MSRFAHHASRRTTETETDVARVRSMAAPALLLAVAIVMIVALTVFRDGSEPAPASTASPELVSVFPYGA